MTSDYHLRSETDHDTAAIAEVHRQAFGPSDPVPALVEGLRQLSASLPTISLVACNPSGAVNGHVMMSHCWLDAPGRLVDVLVLSPLGVLPDAQNQGIGTALLKAAVSNAKRSSAPLLFLEGNPAFYGPRGFEASKPLGIRTPSLRIPDPALQLVRLPSYQEDMVGSLVFRDVFWEHDCVGLR